MQIEINPFSNIVPKIYAYTTPGVPAHDGWTKIGYTEQSDVRDRIYQQTNTADIDFKLEWYEKAQFKSGEFFKDHDFHDYLVRFHHISRKEGKEWFQVNPKRSHTLFNSFVDGDFDGAQISEEHSDYVLRKEQQAAVDMTVAYYNEHKGGGAEFLWNAKPRFGKTLTSYDFMRKIGAKNVLIVTNRPSIANSWYDDFSKFIAHQEGNYTFVSECDALSERAVISRDEYVDIMLKDPDKDYRMVAFESLQGLKGSLYFGGNYDKLKWILDINWDLLIIDEAHEGVDTYKTDTAFENIKRKFTLHLSGTPFKAIAKGKFGQNQIYNWSFSDEQEAKDNWNSIEQNPYAKMPRMNLLTYQMSKIIQDKVNKGLDLSDDENVEYAFDLNEFFKTNSSGKFVYENDVIKFLDALTEQKKFPFSTKELRNELKHTFWLLSRVDSAKALAKLLKQHKVFENYEIIVAAGDGMLDEAGEDTPQSKKSYDRVREAIANHDKTITLSVGQLTTGVTIPEWTAVFMLSNMRSAAEYIQAAFRAQNPYQFEKNGKFYQKENAYIFDFSPERTLLVYDEFANSLYSSTAGGNGTKEERTENVKRLLNFFSVFAEDENGEMQELDAAKVLSIPIAIKSEEVVKRGFMSNFLFEDISNVYNYSAEVINIIKKIKPAEEMKTGDNNIDNASEINLDDEGNVVVDNELVVNQTSAIFGEKVYEYEVSDVAETFENAFREATIVPENDQENAEPIVNYQNMLDKVTSCVAEAIVSTLAPDIKTKAKEEYGLNVKQTDNVVKKMQGNVQKELQKVADEHIRQQKIIEVEKAKELKKADTPEKIDEVKAIFEEKAKKATEKFQEQIQEKAKEVVANSAANVIEELEVKKAESVKRDVDKDIRKHLRGFTRHIPSFIMAYGDENLTISNIENYVKEDVFKDVTSITVDEFKRLRDGWDYTDTETGEKKHVNGNFNAAVFDDSVRRFLEIKGKLANYFDETNEEDIFNYIPPQETNQIFTPKKVVEMMVDQLLENDPKIFDCGDKTFVDFYMKSGLYITEIVKRLYRNELMKSLYPNDEDRIKHILECQVFGFAPTQIIYDIAMSYIFGFDEAGKKISRRNFFQVDTLPYAEQGTLQKLVNEKLGDRVE